MLLEQLFKHNMYIFKLIYTYALTNINVWKKFLNNVMHLRNPEKKIGRQILSYIFLDFAEILNNNKLAFNKR